MMEDRLSELPRGWTLTHMEKLVLSPKNDIVDGPFGSNLKASEYVNEGIPIIRLQNIQRNSFIKKNIRFIRAEKARQLQRHNFSKGDIVITKLGDPLGEACIVPDDIESGIIVADVVRVRIDGHNVSKKYLVYSINSDFVKRQLEVKTKGTTRPRVNLNHIRELELLLPPLPEQHRIVAKIEELFTKLDAGIEALKKVKAQLKRYRQAVLKYALEGKPTQEWREVNKGKIEPASVLLERIKEERKRSEGGRYKALPTIAASGLPELPEGWVWTRLGEVLTVRSGEGLTSYKMETGGKFPVYGGNGISGYHSKFMFPESKLIIGRVGAKCGVVHITQPMSWVTDNALIVDFMNLNMKFLYYSLAYCDLNKYSVSTAQPVVSGSKIYPVPFSLPPLSEQQEIVEEIESRLSVADEVERAAEQSLKQSDRLRQSILKRAFEGKLVPQDPTDEPAEKLLERTKEEKARREIENKREKKNKIKNQKQMELI